MVESTGSRTGLRFPDRLYGGYVFDLDRTIYLGDDLLPGAKRLILKLCEFGKRVIFLSNNPTKDPQMYAHKLTELGLETPPEEIVNTVVTMPQWLLRNHPDTAREPTGFRSGENRSAYSARPLGTIRLGRGIKASAHDSAGRGEGDEGWLRARFY